jgi:hypothetical protein
MQLQRAEQKVLKKISGGVHGEDAMTKGSTAWIYRIYVIGRNF